MSEIRNLTRNGETFYPLTTSSAVINENTGEGLVIDDEPTVGSHNLIESGSVSGVCNNISLVVGNQIENIVTKVSGTDIIVFDNIDLYKDVTYTFTAQSDTAAQYPIHLYLFDKNDTNLGIVISIQSNSSSLFTNTYTPTNNLDGCYLKCQSYRNGNVRYTIKGFIPVSKLPQEGWINMEMLKDEAVTYGKLAVNPNWSSYNVVNPEDYISEIWIDKEVTNAIIEKIEARVAGTSLYVIIYGTNNTVVGSCALNGIGSLSNGIPYSITSVSTIYSIPKDTVVGYVVFKDIDGYLTHPDNVAGKSYLNIPYVYDLVYKPIISSFINSIKKVSNRINDRIEVLLPDTIYAVVGTELNLYNDTIAYSIDKGLQSPTNYHVTWKSGVGSGIDRCFRFKPETSHANKSYSVTCGLYNIIGELVSSKTLNIVVKSKNTISSAKKITFFGDSYGEPTMAELYNNFNDSERFGGTIPTFVGTQGTTYKFNAYGGFTLSDYATAGRKAFRLQVANAPSIVLYGKYGNNGFEWTVIEINVDISGNGNILITKNDPQTSTDAPRESGTLTPGSKTVGEPVNFTNATTSGANPLWDDTLNGGEGGLSLSLYKQRCGLSVSDAIDAVIIQLGTNNFDLGDNLENLDTYVTALYDCFVTNGNANCKFILCLPAKYANGFFGIPAAYTGATDNTADMKRIFDIKKKYLALTSTLQNLVISCVSNAIDRYYGYPLGKQKISDRFDGVYESGQQIVSDMEICQIGYGHPNASGYKQIADANFATLMGCL